MVQHMRKSNSTPALRSFTDNHSQFGNMLVLAATFNSTHMKGLVPEDHFRRLLERTITFLRRLGPISPTCRIDCSILEKIQRVLFEVPAN